MLLALAGAVVGILVGVRMWSGPGETANLVSVAAYASSVDLQMAEDALTEAGIRYVIVKNTTPYGSRVGESHVKVDEELAVKARAAIDRYKALEHQGDPT